jgi:hypothetical protein
VLSSPDLGGEMKHIKTLGLGAIAAIALVAFVGVSSASATELTCGTTHHTRCAVGQIFHADSETILTLDAPFGNVECHVTVDGHITDPGSATTTAKAVITSIVFSNCGGTTVHTLSPGTLEIHTDTTQNDGNGTITSTGTRFTVVHLGVHCIFETNNTHLGTITGSTNTGHHATVDIASTVPRVGGGGGVFCGSSAPLTGSYTITTPTTLVVH